MSIPARGGPRPRGVCQAGVRSPPGHWEDGRCKGRHFPGALPPRSERRARLFSAQRKALRRELFVPFTSCRAARCVITTRMRAHTCAGGDGAALVCRVQQRQGGAVVATAPARGREIKECASPACPRLSNRCRQRTALGRAAVAQTHRKCRPRHPKTRPRRWSCPCHGLPAVAGEGQSSPSRGRSRQSRRSLSRHLQARTVGSTR